MQKDPGQAGRESAVTAQRSDPAEPGQDGVRSGGTRGFVEDAQYCTCVGLRRRRGGGCFGEESELEKKRLKLADGATSPRVVEGDKGSTMEGV